MAQEHSGAARGARDARRAMSEPVDLNRAGRDELSSIEGIGDARADRIIEWRGRNGRFASVDDLQRVPEFTPDLVAAVRDHLRV